MSKSRQRRIVIVATAWGCLIAVDAWVRVMGSALKQYDEAPFERTVENLQRRGCPDIVLMGSSRALFALVPEEFAAATGRQTFNAAISAAVVTEWQLLSRRIFATERPRLVVLGLNAYELCADYQPTLAARRQFALGDLVEHLRCDHPSLNVVENYLRRAVGPAWVTFDKHFELKMWCEERLASVLPSQARQAAKLRQRVTSPDPPDGYDHPWMSMRPFLTLEDRLKTDPKNVVFTRALKFAPKADAIVRFEKLLDWFNERGIAVLVAYIPNSPRLERRWRDVEPPMIEVLARICQEHGAAFLPCGPEDVLKTDAEFVDEAHVGLPLARRISRRAAKEIVTLGLLDRESPRFAGTPGNVDHSGEREPTEHRDHGHGVWATKQSNEVVLGEEQDERSPDSSSGDAH